MRPLCPSASAASSGTPARACWSTAGPSNCGGLCPSRQRRGGRLRLPRERGAPGAQAQAGGVQRHPLGPQPLLRSHAGRLRPVRRLCDRRSLGYVVQPQDSLRLRRQLGSQLAAGSDGHGPAGLQPPQRHRLFHRQRGVGTRRGQGRRPGAPDGGAATRAGQRPPRHHAAST